MSDANSDDDDDNSSPGDAVTNLVAKCTELKAKGNDKFKAGECGAAVTIYQEGVDRLTSEAAKSALKEFFKHNKEAPDTATPLLASLHGNMAACHVKAEQWESAERAASAALGLEPANVKARFRRGVARSNLGQFDEAKADLTAVVRADPKNREARTILEVVNAALKERTSSEKAMFKQAFAGPSLYADEARLRGSNPRQTPRWLLLLLLGCGRIVGFC
jgi:tetratricopeptide (TPR) repeat protein